MVKENLEKVLATIEPGVQLVAVSKYHPISAVQEAYDAGQRVFGESREQELRVKHEELPKDIKWHFIGHLQTNKVKYIAPYIDLIETVDSIKLMKEIDRQAEKAGRVIDILLQLRISADPNKSSGISPEDWHNTLSGGEWKELHHIRIRGVMMMASHDAGTDLIREEFATAYKVFCTLKDTFFADAPHFDVRSYGMSGDYLDAISSGHANNVRVGSAIFC